jgi:hypothetical protein
MDDDLNEMSREALIEMVKRLRAGIRKHRDSSALLPEPVAADVAVPPWPKFLRGCVAFRQSLDKELPGAAIADVEFGER